MDNNIFKKKLVIGIVVLFFGASIIPLISGGIVKNYKISNEPSIFEDWKYKKIIILETRTNEDNFQIKIELNSDDIDFSKINPDGSDIRFCDYKGNKLSYWIEEWNPKGKSIIWVKIIDSKSDFIELYYGNPNAKSESNGEDTFILFDDFNYDNIDDFWEKWYNQFSVITNLENSELTLRDNTGVRSSLLSKQKIPYNTSTRIKFKEKKTGPVEKNGFICGLNEHDTINTSDFIGSTTYHDFASWYFQTRKNGSCYTSRPFGLRPDSHKYNINEFVWKKDIVEYKYNDITIDISDNLSNIPDIDMSIWFYVSGDNSVVCDWVTVTKVIEGPFSYIILEDSFNDDNPDYNKWTEYFNEGNWTEKNKRVEFKLYEPGMGNPNNREGIISSNFTVNLSKEDSVLISCDMIADIESTGFVGRSKIRVTDESFLNYIEIEYLFNNHLVVRDSYDLEETKLNRDKSKLPGIWENQILIFSDRYLVKMDEYQSQWRYRPVFPSEATLRVIIYIQNTGINTQCYYHAGFDNFKVEIPIFGNQTPYPPIIDGPTIIPRNKDWTDSFKFYVTEPDREDIYLYIEWQEDTPGEWILPPQNEGRNIICSHSWDKIGYYTIRAQAIDINGYISDWSEKEIQVKLNRDRTKFSFLKIFRNHSNLYQLFKLFY